MANEEQLRILKEEGVEAWNKWRKKNRDVKIDLSDAHFNDAYFYGVNFRGAHLNSAHFNGAHLNGAILSGAHLNSAYLKGAYLKGAYLNGAILKGAYLNSAHLVRAYLNGAILSGAHLNGAILSGAHLNDAYLKGAYLNGAILSGAHLNGAHLNEADLVHTDLKAADLKAADLFRAHLSGANLKGAHLVRADLKGAYLKGADLSDGDLSGANLTGAHLKDAHLNSAILSGAILERVQALATNFSDATLTGACIKDWNINSKTNLKNVTCNYIYLKKGQQERRPFDPNIYFEPGEFARLFQEVENTIELIFKHGINWKAFAPAFYEENMQVFEREGGEIFLREYKAVGDGLVVLNILTPPNANKEQIRQDLLLKYERLLLKSGHRIAALEGELKAKNEFLAPLYERLLSPGTQMNFNGTVTSVAGNVEGNQNIFTSQSLNEASTEIQNLLTTLQNNGLTQEQAEGNVASDLATTAENNPTALGKLVNWGKSLGNKAAETSVSEVTKRIIKLALNLAGVPLP